MKELTPAQRALIARYLKHQFPWLGTEDGSDVPYPDSGADVIEELETIFHTLTGGK
jgi:hypothetical protein